MALAIATRQLVLADTFLPALADLPVATQKKVREKLDVLQVNPAHPSLNYETIEHAGDPRMRSLRVDIAYRIILAHPNGSGTYILLWVDHHDRAYAWAQRHRLDPGVERRGLAIVMLEERHETPAVSPVIHLPEAPDGSLLADVDDQQLLAVGVPEPFIHGLRQSVQEDTLLKVLGSLREEVAEAVLRLALGEPLPAPTTHLEEQAVALDLPAADAVIDPVLAALQRPESGRRFAVITSKTELDRALTYPLERWRIFLHPEQRAIVRQHYIGPALVSGGAGTGKTVVALHRARHLASTIYTAPTDRILLTTFTHNLAATLNTLMDSLCEGEPELRERIEVVSVHGLAAKLRRLAHDPFGIVESRDAAAWLGEAVREHDTLGLPLVFYRAEWESVVLEREALTEEAYLHVERTGRGRPLTRRQRAAIWPVFAAYQAALVDARREEWPQVVRRARLLVEEGQITLPYQYRAALVDEAQDMGAPEMRLLLALVGQGPDSLLLLGDSRQQIYTRGSYVRSLGIAIGRRHIRLRLNYRTTEQIRAAAAQVATEASSLTGELLGPDDSVSLLSGPEPEVHAFATEEEESQAVLAHLQARLADEALQPAEIAVVARSNRLVTQYVKALQQAGLPCARLEAERTPQLGIQVGTMHRVKGLEFRAVYLVGCSAGILPTPYDGEEDGVERAEHEVREAHLLYVAMTRARELLWISGTRPLSPLLSPVGGEAGRGVTPSPDGLGG